MDRSAVVGWVLEPLRGPLGLVSLLVIAWQWAVLTRGLSRDAAISRVAAATVVASRSACSRWSHSSRDGPRSVATATRTSRSEPARDVLRRGR